MTAWAGADSKIWRPCGRALAICAALTGSAVFAQDKPTESEVVVTGRRGSAITDAAPIATFDQNAVEGIGATSMSDLLRIILPLARSADGSGPIFLLNAQRTSGYEEIGSLPPEAIERMEILPEQAALKFGYPPTRRVLNFITKARFRTIEVKANAGTTTDGGSNSDGANVTLTRIANGRRLTLAGEYRHTDPLRQSRRNVVPDPANPFDAIGNIVSASGGEIDPALSAAAGRPVFTAAAPGDAAQRGLLGAYVAGAGMPRLFNMGPYRTLVAQNDAFKVNAVLATPITKTISGSFTFSAERSRDRSLLGLAAVAILIPATNPHSPFINDVVLDRYLAEAGQLRAQGVTTKIDAGAVVRGALLGWQWDTTATLDENDESNRGQIGVDIGPINRAVAAGADPFAPLTPDLLANRLDQQTHSRNRRADLKGVANGKPLRLPAGDLAVIVTAEAERATTHVDVKGVNATNFSIGQSRAEAGLAFDVPIVSRDDHFFPLLGKLSANLAGAIRHVAGYGALTDTNYGLIWTPVTGVQLSGAVKNTRTAPDMASRSQPTVELQNVSVFDFGTGQTLFVTAIGGGNRDLAAARSREHSIALNLKPFAARELTVSFDYSDTIVHDSTGQITALTPANEAAFPDQFVRDATGRLTTVFFRPVNFYRTHQRNLSPQINYSGQVGKKPTDAGGGKPLPQRPFLYLGATGVVALQNDAQLRRGGPRLDLLNGDTVNGWGYQQKVAIYGWGGLNYLGTGLNFNFQWTGPSRISGSTPQSDLHFGSLFKLDLTGRISIHHYTPSTPWTRKLSVELAVTNMFNRRIEIRDGNGLTPNRFQPDFQDPLGRTVKLTLRKLLF